MRVRRSTPALVLFAVIAGLFTMHTIGHLGPHMGGMTHVAAVSTPMTHDHTGNPQDAVGDNSVGVLSAQPVGGPGLPGDLMALCVAILAAAATIAAAIILLRRKSTGAATPLGRSGWVAVGSRSPPPPGIGLRLADLSVLRN